MCRGSPRREKTSINAGRCEAMWAHPGLWHEGRDLASPILGANRIGMQRSAIAGFEMSITFLLWLTALQRARHAARQGQLIYLTPFLSLLFLHLILGEPLLPATFVGLLLIVGALVWSARTAMQNRIKPGAEGLR